MKSDPPKKKDGLYISYNEKKTGPFQGAAQISNARNQLTASIAVVVLAVTLAGTPGYADDTSTKPSHSAPVGQSKETKAASNVSQVHEVIAHSYRNVQYGFSMRYPADFTLDEPYDGTLFDKYTFRLERGATLASFVYNGSKYQNTNLIGAGIAVGKVVPLMQLGCKTVGLGQQTIGNLTFYHGIGAAALGSISTHFDFWKVEGRNGCFEIRMNTTTDRNSPKPALTEQQKAELKNIMNAIALAFSFE